MKLVSLLSAAVLIVLLSCSERNPRVDTRFNEQASLAATLPFNPLQGRVITSWIDKQNSTMSTLFGNDLAVQHARSSSNQDYPDGSVLAVVTWTQQEDPRWFGGNIPEQTKSVELIEVDGGSKRSSPWFSYQEYEGSQLKNTSSWEGATPVNRVAFLLSQRAAVMP
jgi:hypothetical protein